MINLLYSCEEYMRCIMIRSGDYHIRTVVYCFYLDQSTDGTVPSFLGRKRYPLASFLLPFVCSYKLRLQSTEVATEDYGTSRHGGKRKRISFSWRLRQPIGRPLIAPDFIRNRENEIFHRQKFF